MSNDRSSPDPRSRLWRFVQRHYASFVFSSATPFGAAFLHIVPAPLGHEQLRYAASFLSLAAFVFVLISVESLSRSLAYTSIWKRRAPLAAFVAALAAVGLTLVYEYRFASNDFPNLVLYALVWPCYAGSATTLILCLLHQEEWSEATSKSLQNLEPHMKALGSFPDDFLVIQKAGHENLILREVANRSFQEVGGRISSLAEGKLLVDSDQVPVLFAWLSTSSKRFDAISDREVPCWAGPGDAVARQYFRQTADLAEAGRLATRAFIVSAEDLDQEVPLSMLIEVLSMHMDAGIGIAVAVEDELSVELRQYNRYLDFALWNCGEAVSTFRLEGRSHRQMSVFFDVPQHHVEVEARREVYEEVLAHAFMVDSVFKTNHAERIGKLSFKGRLSRVNAKRQKSLNLPADDLFSMNVKSANELALALQRFADLRRQRNPPAARQGGISVFADQERNS